MGRELMKIGDYVKVSNKALISGLGKIIGFADDDYDNAEEKGYYIVDFGNRYGTCTVHKNDMIVALRNNTKIENFKEAIVLKSSGDNIVKAKIFGDKYVTEANLRDMNLFCENENISIDRLIAVLPILHTFHDGTNNKGVLNFLILYS